MLGGDDPMFDLFATMMCKMSGIEPEDDGRAEGNATRFILERTLVLVERGASEDNMEEARKRLASNPILKEDPDNNNLNADNLFLTACELGMIISVRLLMERPEVNINCRVPLDPESDGFSIDATPLYAAAERNFPDIVALLLTHADIDANAIDSYTGTTPLMIASVKGHVDVVKLLLNYEGVELGIKDTDFKKTALELACFAANIEVVKVFLKSGHKLDVARVSKDICSKEKVARFLTQNQYFRYNDIDPKKAITTTRYQNVSSLLENHLRAKTQKQPTSKGKPRKPPTKVFQPTEPVQPPPIEPEQQISLDVEEPSASTQVNQAVRKKKVRTAEERKAQREDRKAQREAKKIQEEN